MKKNKAMRLASLLLVLVLMTSSVVGGTFAKYTTSATSEDSARVAQWGFTNTSSIELDDLFVKAYDTTVNGYADVIAPGTTKSASFQFTYDGEQAAPEVDYTFKVDTTGSEISDDIKNNPNIKWALYKEGTAEADIVWDHWNVLIYNITCMSGSSGGEHTYKAGTLPAKFTAADEKYVVAWKWDFEDTTNDEAKAAQDAIDTAMGNAATLGEVKLVITITATQID